MQSYDGREGSDLESVVDRVSLLETRKELDQLASFSFFVRVLEEHLLEGWFEFFGIFHYSNEGIASWYDFAIEIFRISGINCLVNPILSKDYPTPSKRPHFSVLDKTKIKSTYGLAIPYWKDSLTSCIKKIVSRV